MAENWGPTDTDDAYHDYDPADFDNPSVQDQRPVVGMSRATGMNRISGYGTSGRGVQSQRASARAKRAAQSQESSNAALEAASEKVGAAFSSLRDAAKGAAAKVGSAAGSKFNELKSRAVAQQDPAPATDADSQGQASERRAGSAGAGSPSSRSGDYLGTGEACVKCGRPVDAASSRCPHCGALQVPFYQNKSLLIPLVGLIALLVILTIAVNSCSNAGGESGGGNAPWSGVFSSVDKSDLQSTVDSANQIIAAGGSEHTYTSAAYRSLSEAVSAAQATLDNRDATEDDVAQATTKLQAVMHSMATALGAPLDERWTWPTYSELTGSIGSFVGRQIAFYGTIQSIQSDEDGSQTLAIAIAEDPNLPLALTVTNLTVVDGAQLSVGSYITFGGEVTGSTSAQHDDGSITLTPAVEADYIR